MAGTLARRRDEALVTDPDDAAAAAACAAGRRTLRRRRWERCAQADAALGKTEEATAAARRAWVLLPGDGAAPAFLRALGKRDRPG